MELANDIAINLFSELIWFILTALLSQLLLLKKSGLLQSYTFFKKL